MYGPGSRVLLSSSLFSSPSSAINLPVVVLQDAQQDSQERQGPDRVDPDRQGDPLDVEQPNHAQDAEDAEDARR